MDIRKKERGSASIEATIVLTLFLLAMCFLICVVQIVHTQTVMQSALNQATKELSRYGYLYQLFGLAGTKSKMIEKAKLTDRDVQSMEKGITDAFQSIQNLDFGGVKSSIDGITISDDFMRNLGITGVNMGLDTIKSALMGKLMKSMMPKYLGEKGDLSSAERRLSDLNVRTKDVQGIESLDFTGSKCLEDAESFCVVMTYQIKTIFPGSWFRYVTVRNASTTRAWIGATE